MTMSESVRPEVAAWGLVSRKGWIWIDQEYLARLIWVPCPPFFEGGENRESWAAESAQLWFQSSESAYGRKEVDYLAKVFASIHQDLYAAGHCHQALIHLPDPRMVPLPVQIGVWAMEGNRGQALQTLAHTDDPEAIGPPESEEFTTERLGTGLKALHYRHAPAEEQPGRFRLRRPSRRQPHAYLNYAWRSEQYETDLRLFTFSDDPGRLLRAIPDIDDLARAIEIVPRRW